MGLLRGSYVGDLLGYEIARVTFAIRHTIHSIDFLQILQYS